MKLHFQSLPLLVVMLAGCGQPGPLYLPDNPPPGIKVKRDDRPAAIPERTIDQMPTPINSAPPKTVEPDTNKNQPESEIKQ